MTPGDLPPATIKAGEKICASLSLTLYRKTSLRDALPAVRQCFAEYVARCGDQLMWYANSLTGAFHRFTAAAVESAIGKLEESAAPFSWIVHGGATQRGLSPFLFEAASRNRADSLDYIRATYPIPPAGADYERFEEGALAWCDRLTPFHGYGGFAFNESPVPHVRQANSRLVFALSQRFYGIEVDNPFLTARSAFDAVKGANWLTILSDPFVNRLNGADALRQRLSAGIKLHPYPGGLLIQAGDAPDLGDIQQGHDLPSYREVAAAIARVRLVKHFPLGPEELGSFGWAGTEWWLRRLDGPSKPVKQDG
jgi:hypothetical protein